MVVGDFWNWRLENWARVFGTRQRAGTSSLYRVMAMAPQRPEGEEAQPSGARSMWAPALDIEDAELVDRLLLSQAVDPVGRLYIIYIWTRRFTLGSFGRPKGEVVRSVRSVIQTLERLEQNPAAC